MPGGKAPPIFFGLAKENGPRPVQKKNAFMSKSCPAGRFGQVREWSWSVQQSLETGAGCAQVCGNRDGASPHLIAWVRLSRWSSNGPAPLSAAALFAATGKGARGEPQVLPVDLPAANQEYSIIFAAARSASPRGIAAAAYAKNMPSAYFLNAAA